MNWPEVARIEPEFSIFVDGLEACSRPRDVLVLWPEVSNPFKVGSPVIYVYHQPAVARPGVLAYPLSVHRFNCPRSLSLVCRATASLSRRRLAWGTSVVVHRDSSAMARQVQGIWPTTTARSEEHTSELQSLRHLVCRLLLEK